MQIGILYHPHKPDSQVMAQEVAGWLHYRKHDTWICANHDAGEYLVGNPQSKMLVVLGGDGSILRSARVATPYNIPIVGINLGRIGFLSEAEKNNWQSVLGDILANRYWLERRLMLQAELHRKGKIIDRYLALNDFVIGAAKARVIRLDLRVDNDAITTYTADSLIAATPTGSTAYSMAAGGPLLPPQLRNFLLIPVAPYLSLDRALVLHEEAVARIRVRSYHDAFLTADGQDAVPLLNEDEIIIFKHQHEASFLRVGQTSYFYRRLLKRLGFER